jgi:hypothetical protein
MSPPGGIFFPVDQPIMNEEVRSIIWLNGVMDWFMKEMDIEEASVVEASANW